MLQVDYVNFSWITFIFLVTYLIFIMPAAVVLPVIFLAPLLVLQGKKKDPDCGPYTEDACKLRKQGGSCEEMTKTFEADQEWKNYRVAICNGLAQQADPKKLKDSYSEAAFNSCVTEAAEIENIIDAFNFSDCERQKDLEGVRVNTFGFPGDWLFLTFGIVGVAVSFFLLASRFSGNKISIPVNRKDGSLGDE